MVGIGRCGKGEGETRDGGRKGGECVSELQSPGRVDAESVIVAADGDRLICCGYGEGGEGCGERFDDAVVGGGEEGDSLVRHYDDALGASGAPAGLPVGFVVRPCECGDVGGGVGDGAEGVVPSYGVDFSLVVRGEAGNVVRVTRAVNGGCFTGIRGPGADSTVGGTGEEGWWLRRPGNDGGGVSLMTLHNPNGFCGGRREIVEVTRQGKGDDHIIGARGGPCHADLVVWDTNHSLIRTHTPGVDRFSGFGVPDLDSLIGTAGREASRVA